MMPVKGLAKGHGRGRRFLVYWATILLRIWFASCRITVIGREIEQRFARQEAKAVVGTWHRGALFLVWYYRRLRPMVMFSRSRDGDLIAGYAENLGVRAARGSTSRGGTTALREMLRHLQAPGPRRAATVLDGPRGPRFTVQAGMLQLARSAGVPFVPVVMSAAPAITLTRTWDRTLIPLPFSRVVVSYGDPLTIGAEIRGSRLDAKCQEVQSMMNRLRREADQMVGYRDS
ncbi:MAG: lysophospholipid acyltransferase family protein [Desulfobacterales bacterium]|nr:lysophospholipid acyltransferase family protein [Desulfobacterales bacterium]